MTSFNITKFIVVEVIAIFEIILERNLEIVIEVTKVKVVEVVVFNIVEVIIASKAIVEIIIILLNTRLI